ncbi:MAG TPA: hypothetical protein VJU78_01565 [Chitinophagaceae bacterium]|nr:hypothetical protein [Chitinophagaceae bacterium]
MSKKMKTPEKTPPSGTTVSNGNSGTSAPTINVSSQAAFTSLESIANAPQLSPPAVQEGETAYGAAVWSTDKRVNALYTTLHARNSWMSIAGIGWKKLATGSDSACEAMTQLAAHCREKNCRIDFSEENGLVNEIYVW